MEVYIDYRDCKNNYKETRKFFKSYDDAMVFMVKTFDTVNSDFINYISDEKKTDEYYQALEVCNNAKDALQPKQANEADTSDESEKVCDNWHCKDGVVMEQYGEKVYCDVCNGTGKLG